MSARSKEELQTLYFELGDALARAGQLPEAADSYAIAMYYARRTGNQSLADLCREQVLACHPNHVGGREESAPLFFAQLLMRYPAEDAQRRLDALNAASTAQGIGGWTVPLSGGAFETPVPGVMASPEPAPPDAPCLASPHLAAPTPPSPRPVPAAVASLDLPEYSPGRGRASSSLAALFADVPVPAPVQAPQSVPQSNAPRPGWPGAAAGGFEQHHAYPPLASPRAHRAADDFEMDAPNRSAPRSERRQYDEGMTWLNPIAAVLALAGAIAAGFFAYRLYPEITRIEQSQARSALVEALQDVAHWCRKTADAASNEFSRLADRGAEPRSAVGGADAAEIQPDTGAETDSSSAWPALPRELPKIADEPGFLPTARAPDPRWAPPANVAETPGDGLRR